MHLLGSRSRVAVLPVGQTMVVSCRIKRTTATGLHLVGDAIPYLYSKSPRGMPVPVSPTLDCPVRLGKDWLGSAKVALGSIKIKRAALLTPTLVASLLLADAVLGSLLLLLRSRTAEVGISEGRASKRQR